MASFPLIRTKWSNERLMALVFAAASLWQLPGWARNPAGLLDFAAVLAFALALDTAANYLRFRKPACAVSAAVTAAVLQALAPAVPLWARLLAVGVALLAGKHIWGGTGTNPVNPAITGLFFLSLLFPVPPPAFEPSLLLIPAILLSLPFIAFRPYAAVGMMAGIEAALLLGPGLTLSAAAGVVFWGCLVMTDPVTVTPRPWAGAITGLLAGFVPTVLSGSAAAMAAGVLAANAASSMVEWLAPFAGHHNRLTFGKGKRIPFAADGAAFVDMAATGRKPECDVPALSPEEILQRIERNRVFGMGGAAFPTHRKIRTVLESGAAEKHLIVNAVECDPGLIHDKWLLRAHPGEIGIGIRLLTQCTPFRSVTVAVKDAADMACPEGARIAIIPDFYPAGAERILIRQVLKRDLPAGAIPAREGILVLNVQTVFAIYEAVCLDAPADRRFITVAHTGNGEGHVARVSLGAPVNEIADELFPAHGCVFTGGGMMQARMADDGDVVGSSVNFIAAGPFPAYRESPLCSKCGLCAGVCPAGLKAYEIARLMDEGKTKEALRYHPEQCLTCGSCSHVCLAGRNLSARVKAAKEAALA